MSLRFYNTLTQQLEEFKPLHDNVVRMYTCGPTVYNYAHIGNFRSFVFPDILRRWLGNKTPEIVASWIGKPGNSVLVAIGESGVLSAGAVVQRVQAN